MPYTLSKLDLFLKLSKYDDEKQEGKLVNVNEFKGRYLRLRLGNGGSWCRRRNLKQYKVALIKQNGVVTCLWNARQNEYKKVKKYFDTNCKIKGKTNSIAYIKIFGTKEIDSARPIRKDIRDFYKKQPCCVCGSNTDLVCDHKNDLYNDKRVLNVKTQKLSDFQSLCNHCNLQKRTVMVNTKITKRRYGATNIPQLKCFGVDFIKGTEKLTKSKNALVGTYWYDPVLFMKTILKGKM